MKILARQRRHSLSSKLILLFILSAIVFVVLVGGSFSKVFRDHFEHNVRPHLVQYINYVQHDIGMPPDKQRAAALAKKLKVAIYISGPEGEWSSTGTILNTREMKFKHHFQQNGIDYSFGQHNNRDIFLSRLGQTSYYFDIPDLKSDHRGNGFIPILVLLIILFVLYHLIVRLIRPVNTLIDGVRRFGQGEIEHRIVLNRTDELGELADSYNEMADDIQQMLDAKRQLLLAISHELRSPLTRAKVSLELLNDDQHKQELVKDLNEMESLIEELLESERLINGHQALNKHMCNISIVIEELLQQNFNDMQITTQLPDEAVLIEIDEIRIKLLIKNLLENALRHTPDNAMPPTILMQQQTDQLTITIKDHGNGIEARHIPLLTEPFYRADESRQRETGGYGLGLYLCRVIAESHNGQLIIESKIGNGTSVIVKLPC